MLTHGVFLLHNLLDHHHLHRLPCPPYYSLAQGKDRGHYSSVLNSLRPGIFLNNNESIAFVLLQKKQTYAIGRRIGWPFVVKEEVEDD